MHWGSSIFEGYIIAKVMFYINDYVLRLHQNALQLRKSIKKDPKDIGIVLQRRGSIQTLNPLFYEQVHRFLLMNMS